MPLYEYECDACGRRFEVIQRFSDRPAESCSLCGSGPVRKLLSSPAIQFKGSGWYITDYARKDQKAGAKGDQKETAASGETATAKDKAGKDKGTGSDKAAAGGGGEKSKAASASSSSSKE
jgi:putative FmdB family regulatory protein